MNSFVHNVLFTGGLASTYRLCQLCQSDDAVIQPIYLIFSDDGHPHKRSEIDKEIEVQNIILQFLNNHPLTKANLLPIKRIHRNEIPSDVRVFSLEKDLAEYQLGWQYLYFALLSQWYKNLELCYEDNSLQRFSSVFNFIKHDDYYLLDDLKNSFWTFLFKDIRWHIFRISRSSMIKDIISWYGDKIISCV